MSLKYELPITKAKESIIARHHEALKLINATIYTDTFYASAKEQKLDSIKSAIANTEASLLRAEKQRVSTNTRNRETK